MGYLTCYNLEIITAENEIVENTMLEKIAETNENINWYLQDACIKWYDHHEDMEEISKDYPHHIFQLTGEGEEKDDMWQCRYQDGKSECIEPEIIWPIYEEIKEIQQPPQGDLQIGAGDSSSGDSN